VAAAPLLLWLGLLLAGCAGLPARQQDKVAADAPAAAAAQPTTLMRLADAQAAWQPAGHSGFRLLIDPQDALDARMQLIDAAERTLDLQYYIFKDDALGQALVQALARAAARGVRVRLLVDDLYAQDCFLAPLAALPGVQVRLFNPLPAREGGTVGRVLASLHEFKRINHRMHNKLLLADDRFSVSGGRNIGTEYFMQSMQSNFIDLDVLGLGPVVHGQTQSFERYWFSAHTFALAQFEPTRRCAGGDTLVPGPIDRPRDAAPALLQPEALAQFTWGPARVLADDPSKIMRESMQARFAGSVSEQALATLDTARERVVIVTPYFIPGEAGLSIMARARQRGVTTIVVTNSLGSTDEPIVHAGYARYRKPMLEQGVTIYEVSPVLSRRLHQFGNFGRSQARLHSKMALVDQRWFYVGSMNLDARSASLNTEAGLIIDSPELVRRFLDVAGPDRFSGAYEVRLAPDGTLRWLELDGQTVHTREPDAGWLYALFNWLVPALLDEELL